MNTLVMLKIINLWMSYSRDLLLPSPQQPYGNSGISSLLATIGGKTMLPILHIFQPNISDLTLSLLEEKMFSQMGMNKSLLFYLRV